MNASDRAAMQATTVVCDFIVGYRLTEASAALIDRAKSQLIDTFGVAIAAVDSDVAAAIGSLGASRRTSGPVTAIGRGRGDDAGLGALLNGALAHAIEFDDSTLAPIGHPSCVIVPALFALAEQEATSGAALLEAYLVGLEVHSRLGQAEAGGWTSEGRWLPLGHVAVLGAAAACARLLSLDPVRTEQTLGLATHFCGGIAASNGAMAKPIGAGVSARAGVEAALLARSGATGAKAVLERPNGFADIFLGPGHDLPKALEHLGSPHRLEEVGIAIKRYPSVYATHWGVDALLLLLSEYDLGADDIESIRLDHPVSAAFCDNGNPASSEEARFSHEFNLAAAVLDGIPGPESYLAARIAKDDMASMLPRITARSHPSGLEPPMARAYVVTATAKSGFSASKSVRYPLGHPRNPMSAADLDSKFHRCVQNALTSEAAAGLLGALRDIDSAPDVHAVSAALSAIRGTRTS